ncbi:sporulation protein [Leptolyngbya sp. 'hensonii']|uniref:SpoIID/LytB domain-containing protein n=1 Tax=Leptolyngbya sp. 'hensonii' TaxID=1922337 RepID=UPI00094FFCAF|nr:SpoIID/LytB domain-containing protein [Leptolyngbya sp. 'hensonii']OLP16148.1 sporulation protein [Leptolyngbya sp. 'hensonii']
MLSHTILSTPISLLARLKQQFWCQTYRWSLPALVWLATIAPAGAQVELRVALEEGVSQVQVASSTKAIVRESTGRLLGEMPPGSAYDARMGPKGITLSNQFPGSKLWIEPTAGGYVWVGDRWYRGRLLLLPAAKGLTVINFVDLEQYLYSVLGGEMRPDWPQEALKAQAVAARSYALYKRQHASKKLFDLGDSTASQVYKGLISESAGTQMAVRETQGQVLIYKGQIIQAVFHSSAGGRTENSEFVWTQALPYLRSVPDFDQGTPNYEWVKVFSSQELKARLPGLGNILSFIPQRLAPSGRIITMKVVGDAGSRIMSGNDLRNALNLKSTLFVVTPQAATNGIKDNVRTPSLAFQVSGRGFGHGLGMSQWGAYNMAVRGMNYQQIVLYYYKGAALARIQVR